MRQYLQKNINQPDPNSVTGNLEVTENLTVGGDATIDGNLQLNGNSLVDGNSQINGDLLVNQNVQVEGVVSITDNLTTDAELIGRLVIPVSAKTIVPVNENYAVLSTDRLILVSTSMAGDRIITLGNHGDTYFQLTILMTAVNIGSYTINTTIQGDFNVNGEGAVATVLHTGNGVWTVLYFI